MAEAKKAIQRIVTDESGNIRIIYVDLETLKTVPDPSNYQVVNANQQNIEQVVNINDPDPVPLNPTSITDKLGRQTPLEQSRELLGEGGRGGQEGVRSVGGNNPTSPVDTSVRSPETLGAPVGTVERSSLGSSVGGRQRETSSNSVGVTTAENSRSTQVTPGGGMANLVDRGAPAGVSLSMGPNRPNAPAENVQQNIATSVGNVFGQQATTQITSGQQNSAQLAQIERGKAAAARERAGGVLTAQEQKDKGFAQANVNKNDRHPTGKAADFTVSTNDPNKTLSQVAMEDIAMDFAARNPTAGVGYGKGYMGPNVAHLDVSGLGGTWGQPN